MSKGRHRIGRVACGVAAVGTAIAVGGVAATQPASVSAPLVDLAALIVVGSSTHPEPSGNEDFFGGKFNQAPYNPGSDLIPIDFRSGTTAIELALQDNSGEANAVLASGWGAANASLVLSRLNRAGDPALPTSLFILDNNVSRPDGGFGTRYPLFALIGVNPFPSPTDTAAKAVVDIAYQYNYNSNAPADLLNLVAHVNSLVAYLYGYREQSGIDLPVDVDGNPTLPCGGANTCAVLAGGGDALPCDDARCTVPAGERAVAYVTIRGNTTYVTYTTDELPLTRLIRDVFGDTVADASAPLLKLIVDSAYYDGNPISSDPSRYRPARLMPSLGELISTASKVPAAIREGLETLSDNNSQQRSVPAHETVTVPVDDDDLRDDVQGEDAAADAVQDDSPADTNPDVNPDVDPDVDETADTDDSESPDDESTTPEPENGQTAQDGDPSEAGSDAESPE